MDRQHEEQPCPLCNGPAHWARHEGANAKMYTCGQCRSFIATRTVEPTLRRSPPEWLRRVSAMTRHTPPGKVVRIQGTRPIDEPVDRPTAAIYVRYRDVD